MEDKDARNVSGEYGKHEMTKPSLILTINTFIVLAMTAAVVAMAISGIVYPGGAGPVALVLIVMVPVTLVGIAFGVVVFRSGFSRSKDATLACTLIYFLMAGFVLFGVIANIGEALLQDSGPDWQFVIEFGMIGFAVEGYAILCGLLSLRWYQRLKAVDARSQPVVSSGCTLCSVGRARGESDDLDIPEAQAAVPAKRTSRFAIASLVLSCSTVVLLLYGFIPGIICGHIARSKCRKDPNLDGEGLALAGLIVGYSFLAIFMLALVLLWIIYTHTSSA